MYVDIVLMENLIIDFFILKVTSKLSKVKTTSLKLLIGAIPGAAYAVIVFLPSMQMFSNPSMKIAVSALMIIIAFTPNKFIEFLRIISIFYFISFAFGGAIFAVYYLSGRGTIVGSVFLIYGISLPVIVTGFAISYLLMNCCWNYVQDRLIKKRLIYNVSIEVGEKSIETNAILDTGNSLKEPISNLPVIVVEYEVMKDILPNKLVDILNSKETEFNFEKLSTIFDSPDWKIRIRLIPFSSLGKQNGMMIGIKPDSVRLTTTKYVKEVKDVIIGLYNNKISKDGEYRALLYYEILS
jgi:stage II sporulation protein GA (sporulation sigma-E factor processing peptidase)